VCLVTPNGSRAINAPSAYQAASSDSGMLRRTAIAHRCRRVGVCDGFFYSLPLAQY